MGERKERCAREEKEAEAKRGANCAAQVACLARRPFKCKARGRSGARNKEARACLLQLGARLAHSCTCEEIGPILRSTLLAQCKFEFC